MTQWRRNEDDERHSLLENYISHFIWKIACERKLETEQRLQYIDPHSCGHQLCVFLVLQGCSTGGSGAHSAGCYSLYRILSPNSPISKTNCLPVFTELYNSSVAHSISLEWHVWSSSSRNNCHAVQRSLSSGASVYDCTMRFYLVPYGHPSPPTRLLPITAIGMCHFRSLWNGMFGRVEGQYTIVEAIKKGAIWSPSTKVAYFTPI